MVDLQKMNDEDIEFIEAQASDFDDIVEIAADAFMTDRYFMKQIPDQSIRRQELQKIYREGIDICQKNFGGVLVIKKNYVPAGFLMYFDYKKFRRQNLAEFKKVFGFSIQNNKVSHGSFAEIHRCAMRLKDNPVYVLAIAVSKKYQNQGLGKKLFEHFLQKFAGCSIMSDVSGPFFKRLCGKCGFEMKSISDTCDLVLKSKEA